MYYYRQLYVNGKCSGDYGLYVDSTTTLSSPSRKTKAIDIQGRNGTFYQDLGGWNDQDVKYHMVIPKKYMKNYHLAKTFLLPLQIGWCHIEDSRFPNEYRIGRITSPIEMKSRGLDLLEFDVTIEYQPEHYVTPVETWPIHKHTVLQNPNLYGCKFVLKMWSDSSIVISNSLSYTLSNKPTGWGIVIIDGVLQRTGHALTSDDTVVYDEDVNKYAKFDAYPTNDIDLLHGSSETVITLREDNVHAEVEPHYYYV